MGIFTGFEKGSHGTYKYNEEIKEWIRVSAGAKDPNAGLNGPIWFPKGGTKYFDLALQREFTSLAEKKDYLREHKLCMSGDSKDHKGWQAKGIGSTYFSIPNIKK